jgi:hypothetical protein
MKTRHLAKVLTIWSICFSSSLASSSARASEIKVSLFGQPCLLDGPFTQSELKTIHAISPEQLDVGPDQTSPKLKDHVRAALKTLKSNSVPSPLSRYKESYQKRLQAQIEFFDALDELKTTQKNDTLFAVGKRNLSPKAYKAFEAQMKSLSIAGNYSPLLESYNEGIEAEPEEEFHRAILAANVHYTCSFEEHPDQDGE